MYVSDKSLLVARTRLHKPKQIETIKRRHVYVCVCYVIAFVCLDLV